MSDVPFKEFLIKSRLNIVKAIKYKNSYDKIMESGLFDKKYYLESYPHIKGIDPLLHYLYYGYKENKSPNPQFNLTRYMEDNPEIHEKKLNPLIYYIEHNHEGFFLKNNPHTFRKKKIIDTNRLFLNNYEFESEPLVSIIILNRNGLNHLKCLFKDFDANTNYSNYEIIVVDNASNDKSVEFLKSLNLPITVIENDENVSFSKGNNDAAKIAKGEYLLLLNNDIEPTYGWLNELVGVMLNNEGVGSVGAKLVFPYYSDMDNQPKSFTIQHAGVKFREERTPYVYGPYHEWLGLTLLFSDYVNHEKTVISNTAACLLISKKIYDEIGGLDENYFYGYEDIDFAFKMYKLGYKSIYNPRALLFHHESATRVEDIDEKNRLNYENIMYFYNKWNKFLFKELLKDKIESNKFLTDKKLDFSIISKNNKIITDLTLKLNTKGYNVKLIPNIRNLDIGGDCDILISFNKDYDIKNVSARLNLIKVLVSDDNVDGYDIIISNDEFSENKLLDTIGEYYGL